MTGRGEWTDTGALPMLRQESVRDIVRQVNPKEVNKMLSIYAQELLARGEARREARRLVPDGS